MLAKHMTLFVVLTLVFSLMAAVLSVATYNKLSKLTLPTVRYAVPVETNVASSSGDTVVASPVASHKPGMVK